MKTNPKVRCAIASAIMAMTFAAGGAMTSQTELGGRLFELHTGADQYEKFMGRWSQRLAGPFLKFAGVRDGERVLDVGSGTGSLTLTVAGEMRDGEIVGIDLSPAYIDFARRRASDPRIRFQVGDAQNLEFPDTSFDRCVSMLVVNFIPDARKAVGEMRRVTKPGGWVATCVWDYNEGMRMLRLFWDAAVALDPASERLDERHMPYCRKGQLAALWRESGFQDVEATELVIDMPFRSFEDYWSPFLGGQGPAGSYVAALSEERRQALEKRLRLAIIADKGDASFSLKARAWAVRGRVPSPGE